MDSADLDGLVKHFSDKVDQFEQLLPFARLCKHKITRRLEDSRILEQDGQVDLDDLPDLGELTDLLVDSKNMLAMLDETLTTKEAEMRAQHKTVLELVSDASSHMDYLSCNFPVDFGKVTEASKPKYGIHVSRKPVAGKTGKATGPVANRAGNVHAASKPPQPGNEVAVNKKRNINSTTVTTLPAAKTQARQQKQQQQQPCKDQKSTNSSNTTNARPDVAAKSSGISSRTTAATISSMQKSASKPVKSDIKKTTASLGMNDAAGKGPTIPVRLTKKLLTMREHQLNRMKSTEDAEE